MKFLKDSLSHYKGYFVGNFFDPNTLNFDESVEINFTKFADDFSAPRHYHSQSKTWVIVTKGAMYFKVDGEAVTIKAGEFLIFNKGVEEEVLRVDPGTESFTIHTPSVKGGDKVSTES